MRPSLLDLGIALAAGAAAAFADTRPGVSSALAGIAIAVALVPRLCTVGIAIAFGKDVICDGAQFLLWLSHVAVRQALVRHSAPFLL